MNELVESLQQWTQAEIDLDAQDLEEAVVSNPRVVISLMAALKKSEESRTEVEELLGDYMNATTALMDIFRGRERVLKEIPAGRKHEAIAERMAAFEIAEKAIIDWVYLNAA